MTNFNTALKVCKFNSLTWSHSVFDIFLLKFHISKVQTLNFRNLKFEQNCSYIGGVNTRPLKIVAILFNLTVPWDWFSLLTCHLLHKTPGSYDDLSKFVFVRSHLRCNYKSNPPYWTIRILRVFKKTSGKL